MNEIELPIIGLTDLDSNEDYYEGYASINGQSVHIDVNLDDDVSGKWYKGYSEYAGKLDEYDKGNHRFIEARYLQTGIVKEYIDWHLEDMREEIDKLLDNTDKELTESDRILSLIKVERIGFYFDDNNYATWDYSFGSETTDQILAIITDKNGDILDVTWES